MFQREKENFYETSGVSLNVLNVTATFIVMAFSEEAPLVEWHLPTILRLGFDSRGIKGCFCL